MTLTSTLKTGDKVEILTGKEIKPSRDWINPNHNYLKTARAKAKVVHWFKMQDFEKNKEEGREVLEKELKVLGIKADRLQEVLPAFHFKRVDDLQAAIGRGDVKLSHVINRLTPTQPTEAFIPVFKNVVTKPDGSRNDLRIEGVGSLLTTMARCCQPVPGDQVIGYITLGRGVSVHRQDCSNIIHSSEKQRQRFLEVSWGEVTCEQYMVDVLIKAFDRPGLLRDITALLSNEKAHVHALQTQINAQENKNYISLTVAIEGLAGLSRLLSKLGQIPNVLEARRQVGSTHLGG